MDRKTVRTNKHAVERKSAALSILVLKKSDYDICIHTIEEDLEFGTLDKVVELWVPQLRVFLHTPQKFQTTHRECKQTCNLKRETGDKNVRPKINLQESASDVRI